MIDFLDLLEMFEKYYRDAVRSMKLGESGKQIYRARSKIVLANQLRHRWIFP